MPILLEILTLATQIGFYKPNLSLLVANHVTEQQTVEPYINKPLVITTEETKEPPKRYIVSYSPPQASKSDYSVERVYQDDTNNCVSWAKAQTSIYRPIGNGGRSGVQGSEPRIGAIGVERTRVHAFVVVDIKQDSIVLRESNFVKGWITQREIPFSDVIGYIYS